MDIEIKTWLKDIEQAILEINSFVPDVKNFRAFQKDLKTKRAVERNIAIIGEAVSRILKVNPAIKISHTRKIVDTRNRIIHGYDSVSEDILWGIFLPRRVSLRTLRNKQSYSHPLIFCSINCFS